MRRLSPVLVAAVIGAASLVVACRSATEITVEVDALDVTCDEHTSSAIVVGDRTSIEDRAPSASRLGCTGGRLGTLVVTPSAGKDAEVGVKVVVGVGTTADDCVEHHDYSRCIVARRILRFVPHDDVRVVVPIEADCEGHLCDPTQTCVHGGCSSAVIPAPEACPASGCDVASLADHGTPTDGGGAGGSGGAAPGGSGGATVTMTGGAAGRAGAAGAAGSGGGGAGGSAGSGGAGGGAAGASGAAGTAGAAGAGGSAGTGGSGGSTTTIGSPIDTTLAVGAAQACAIEGGKVSCWGYAPYVLAPTGGTATSATTPTALPSIDTATLGELHAITVRGDHACVIVGAARDLVCWGDNSEDAVGTHDGHGAAPTKLTAVGPVLEVRASFDVTCARTPVAGPNIACWGSSKNGELGPGVTDYHAEPELMAGVNDATLLRAARSTFCASTPSGVICWGSADATPEPVPLKNVVDLAVGGLGGPAVSALDSNGRVTWSGRDGSTGVWSPPADVVDTDGVPIGEAAAIAQGAAICAVTADRSSVRCIVLDTAGPQSKVASFSFDGHLVQELAVGYGDPTLSVDSDPLTFVGCARTDGGIYCWGDDALGAVGDGQPSLQRSASVVPNVAGVQRLFAATTVTSFVAGDGTVTAWGRSPSLFGDPSVHGPSAIVGGAVLVSNPAVATVRVDAPDDHAYVSDGATATRLVYGAPDPGSLGTMGANAYADVQPGPTLDVGYASNASAIFGYADDNYLERGILASAAVSDNPRTVHLSGAISTLAYVGLLDDFAYVCVLLVNGDVRCWGDARYGQCGTGSTDHVDTPTVVVTNAKSLCAAGLHGCAATDTGVSCWGTNENGEIDPAKPHEASGFATPTIVAGVPVVDGVACGDSFSCAWTSSTVWCWGENTSGNVGDPSVPLTTATDAVATVKGFDAADVIDEVVAGDDHACAVLASGLVKCWGSNVFGQCGGPSTGTVGTPQLLVFP